MFCLAMFLLLAFCICIFKIYITTIMWLSTEVIQMQCLALTISQTISHTCYARFVRLGHMVKHARWVAFHYFGVISTKWDENHMKPHRKIIAKVFRNLLNFR